MKNTSTYTIKMAFILFAILSFSFNAHSGSTKPKTCKAHLDWITSPDAPAEVPGKKKADFCDFYSFSWQWFLQLVNTPATPTPTPTSVGATATTPRNFQVNANYPVLEGKGENSCDDEVSANTLFTTLNKSDDAVAIPDRTGQAGTSGLGIYDQNGNVVFYNIRFSRHMCDVGKIQLKPNFPSGTTEIKTAWKQLTVNDNTDDYFVMEANIDGIAGNEKLGMIGFHLAMATTLHPEMIWASFEHVTNSPECAPNTSYPGTQWSFASQECIYSTKDCKQPWNVAATVVNPPSASPVPAPTGTPSEICKVYPYGTHPSDPHYDENIAAITQLNTQIHALLSKSSAPADMKVWKNYINIGALWLSDSKKPSATADTDIPVISNQRGSLRLANTVMETTFQKGFISAKEKHNQYSSNCFGCHEYTVDKNYWNTGPHNQFDVSHIFINDILAGQCISNTDVVSTEGAISDDRDAQQKCAITCSTKGGWKGEWTQKEEGSVCGCCNAT